RDDEAGHRGGRRELTRLLDRVLPGGPVENEQHFVRRPLARAPGDADDLPELVHEVTLRVEATGGVGDDRGVPSRTGRAHRVEDNGGWVAVGLPGDDRHTHAVGPALQLLDGRGAKSVGRREQRALAGVLQSLGELRRRRRLSAAVDADHENHPRLLTLAAEPYVARERTDERLADRGERLRYCLHLAGGEEIAQLCHERIDERHRQVGAKESFLERVEPLGAERLLAASEEAREKSAARLYKALVEAHFR